jgi:hypothetical protein
LEEYSLVTARRLASRSTDWRLRSAGLEGSADVVGALSGATSGTLRASPVRTISVSENFLYPEQILM